MQLTGWYADVSKTSPHLRDEGQLFPLSRSFSELEIQARWFAGEFGTEFVGVEGPEFTESLAKFRGSTSDIAANVDVIFKGT